MSAEDWPEVTVAEPSPTAAHAAVDVERIRARWRNDRMRYRRRVSQALDDLLGVDQPDGSADLDYHETGLDLDVQQREAAGARHPWRWAA